MLLMYSYIYLSGSNRTHPGASRSPLIVRVDPNLVHTEETRDRRLNDRSGFQIHIKENKTPGGENCLDPPGAELLAWL